MKTLSCLFLLLFLGVSAHAETTLEIDGDACSHLVNYARPPGVEYKPGVDAYGHPVAPADMGGGSPIKLPTKFTIPITDYLYSQLSSASGNTTNTSTSTPAPNGVVQPALTVGVVTFDTATNQLTFNGQPLTADPDGALGQLCRQAGAQQ